ncbi:GTP-binding protein [Halomonas eurihalina]|uniref:GTP-binding protein n=1 Tax=Halomonas eurihalina TaxID=42566 RepID=A0A5D9CJ43_HALER|nr:GTP-binding protein [Halomonas eurihalina]MDR5858428.1 GTP-binding protein [Halomonas eurihalina]TZG31694.1 GTP-binding protein [Halomonas eurihalina]
MSQATLSSVPVHVITGFLGAGKSSLIHHLLVHKPAGERWAVVINEFGRVGIDQTMFEARDDLVVESLPGGCLCCQQAVVLRTSLVRLLRRHRPDRLIIEPSGLGHPAGLLDLLRGEGFADVLDIRGVVAVLDPRRLDDARAMTHGTFLDQLHMADAVALTMTDLATTGQVAAARHWLEGFWPSRRWVCDAPYGRLPSEVLLSAEPGVGETRAMPVSHHHAGHHAETTYQDASTEPRPGKPVLEWGEALGHASLGWRWHSRDRFDRHALEARLESLPAALRVKGVLHTDRGWLFYNRVAGRGASIEVRPSVWRHDSRLELLGEPDVMPDAKSLEASLAACLEVRR